MIITEYNIFCYVGLLMKRLEFFWGEGYISLNWDSKLVHPIIRLTAGVEL